ncbi:NADP-dependent oxidoreductase domain-containing protein [Phlebopus sp. FC_14]|nr:NADP-dependent oxidoreductase domain-containing protein [Phlebopus sp. FC_14]
MRRMDTTCIDLLQFYWQDYSDKGYITALQHLQDLQNKRLISAICSKFGKGFIFSLIDTRPLNGMADVCKQRDVKLLTYGTLCGGFLADKWLDQPQPDLYASNLTPSQRKYLDMILQAWGDWPLFQSLLAVLRLIGDRHGGLSISNIATRWVLDHDFVGAVIIGARLGISEHLDDNRRVDGFKLSEEDNNAIKDVLARSKGRDMIREIGGCGDEYR